MKYFLCRLIPPRPTFAQDMTDAEAKVMGDHVAYWTELAEKGTAIVQNCDRNQSESAGSTRIAYLITPCSCRSLDWFTPNRWTHAPISPTYFCQASGLKQRSNMQHGK